MGNICRSPTADGVFRQKLIDHGLSDLVRVDSAGTHNYHPDSPPDERSQLHAFRRGYDLSPLRARQVVDDDYAQFDLILAMDWDNLSLLQDWLLAMDRWHLAALKRRCPADRAGRLRLLMAFAEGAPREVPDPYYGGAAGFEQVLDLVEDASEGLIQHVRQVKKL